MTDAPAPRDADITLDALGRALARADALDEALMAAIAADQYSPYDGSVRVSAACVKHGQARWGW